jgi:transcriptional regulator with XRE-family HTH domain
MSIAKNLKMIRAKYALSQKQLAELMSITVGMIKSYENNIANPPTQFLLKLSEMTGIAVNELMFGDIHAENLLDEMRIDGVEEPEEQYRQQTNLYDIRNMVEVVKHLQAKVSELEKKITP